MLMYAMLERLRNRADTAFVLDVSWGAMALLGFLLNDLGLPDPGPKLEARRETLNRFLLAHRNTPKPVIAVLDDAHNLDHGSLEEINALLDYAPLSFHVVLAGQIHFTTLLSSLTNPRLVKRVTRWYHLVPLGPKEIRNTGSKQLAIREKSCSPTERLRLSRTKLRGYHGKSTVSVRKRWSMARKLARERLMKMLSGRYQRAMDP
jgi:hypothetical protein